MNKAEKKFVGYAVLAIGVLTAVLLLVINLIGFSMVSGDADRITERLLAGETAKLPAESGTMPEMPNGEIPEAPSGEIPEEPSGEAAEFEGRGLGQNSPSFGPMGPDSPEMNDSLRYFTVKIGKDGEAKLTAYHINAVTSEEAVEWTETLVGRETGWTRGTYRFRTVKKGNETYVVVIDQGRELLPCFRILLISVGGAILGTLISFFALMAVGKKLFSPLEEADRKQKQFIEQAQQKLKVPLTVISANTELIERATGSTEETRSIHRQVKKMSSLVQSMETLTVVELSEKEKETVNLAALVRQAEERYKNELGNRNISLTVNAEQESNVEGDGGALAKAIDELFKNFVMYAKTEATAEVCREHDRIRAVFGNDTDLPDGSYDEAFDRFTVLQNGTGNQGLGLALVKEVVKSANGRCRAAVENGRFTVTIDL